MAKFGPPRNQANYISFERKLWELSENVNFVLSWIMLFFKLATFRETSLIFEQMCWWVKSYICVEFGPMWTTHKEVFGGLLELRTLMIFLGEFWRLFPVGVFHHVWPLLLVARCQGAYRRFHWCNFLSWWSGLFLWFFLLLCLARDLRSYFLSSWSHGWISSSGLLFHTVWCQPFGLLIYILQFLLCSSSPPPPPTPQGSYYRHTIRAYRETKLRKKNNFTLLT